LVVPATMTYDLVLSDGIEVWLNSESQLKFPFSFSADKREVWVNGEAYFKVSRDAHRPLIVHTPAYDIQVLGTEFNVNAYDSLHSSTSLVSGAINTRAANGGSVVVKPGYQATFSRGEGFRITTFDSDSELSWMKGIYYFQNALLVDIAPVVQRWYGARLVFDDPKMAGSRFTGALRKGRPLNEFLENLSVTSGITYTSGNGVVHLATHGR
jgi:transmembrane sensor